MSEKKLPQEEQAIWQQAVQNVQPLKQKSKNLSAKKSQLSPPQDKAPRQTKLHQRKINSTTMRALRSEDAISYRTQAVSNILFKDLQTGKMAPFATLDLHGLTVAQAKRDCLHFLHQAKKHEWPVVKIIHGKGGTQEEIPILKNQLNYWLRQIKSVQAFCSTPGRHGGTGAVYVLLGL